MRPIGGRDRQESAAPTRMPDGESPALPCGAPCDLSFETARCPRTGESPCGHVLAFRLAENSRCPRRRNRNRASACTVESTLIRSAELHSRKLMMHVQLSVLSVQLPAHPKPRAAVRFPTVFRTAEPYFRVFAPPRRNSSDFASAFGNLRLNTRKAVPIKPARPEPQVINRIKAHRRCALP